MSGTEAARPRARQLVASNSKLQPPSVKTVKRDTSTNCTTVHLLHRNREGSVPKSSVAASAWPENSAEPLTVRGEVGGRQPLRRHRTTYVAAVPQRAQRQSGAKLPCCRSKPAKPAAKTQDQRVRACARRRRRVALSLHLLATAVSRRFPARSPLLDARLVGGARARRNRSGAGSVQQRKQTHCWDRGASGSGTQAHVCRQALTSTRVDALGDVVERTSARRGGAAQRIEAKESSRGRRARRRRPPRANTRGRPAASPRCAAGAAITWHCKTEAAGVSAADSGGGAQCSGQSSPSPMGRSWAAPPAHHTCRPRACASLTAALAAPRCA